MEANLENSQKIYAGPVVGKRLSKTLDTPQFVSVSMGTDDVNVFLKWHAVDNAASFVISRSPQRQPESPGYKTFTIDSPSVVDGKIVSQDKPPVGWNFYYFVQALDADNTPSAWSDFRKGRAGPSIVGWGMSEDALRALNDGDFQDAIDYSLGKDHVAALLSDGRVKIYGLRPLTKNQANIPSRVQGQCLEMVAGYEHTLALLKDGTVEAWGDDTHDQSTVPPGLDQVIDIAAGEKFSLALRQDGTVVGWGKPAEWVSAVAQWERVTDIAVGGAHCLALLSDRTVRVLVDKSREKANWVAQPSELKDVLMIAAGLEHCVVLYTDESVDAWGRNDEKQCDLPEKYKRKHYGPGSVVRPRQASGTKISIGKALSKTLVQDQGKVESFPALPNDDPARNSAIGAVSGNEQETVGKKAGAPYITQFSPDEAHNVRTFRVVPGQYFTCPLQVTASTQLTYSWKKGGVEIHEGWQDRMVIESVRLEDAGEYRLTVSDGTDNAESGRIVLVVMDTQTRAAVRATGAYALGQQWMWGDKKLSFLFGGYYPWLFRPDASGGDWWYVAPGTSISTGAWIYQFTSNRWVFAYQEYLPYVWTPTIPTDAGWMELP